MGFSIADLLAEKQRQSLGGVSKPPQQEHTFANPSFLRTDQRKREQAPICVDSACDNRTSKRTNHTEALHWWRKHGKRKGEPRPSKYHHFCQSCYNKAGGPHREREAEQAAWEALERTKRQEALRGEYRRVQKARKDHQCYVCERDIPKGSGYWLVQGYAQDTPYFICNACATPEQGYKG